MLLVERFDRYPATRERRGMVSALTILGLGEMFGRYATYPDLADHMRMRFSGGHLAVRELFSRIVFNILVGNTDDHLNRFNNRCLQAVDVVRIHQQRMPQFVRARSRA